MAGRCSKLADAVELNIYFLASDPHVAGAQVEQAYIDIVKALRHNIHIPMAVKLAPFFSSLANMAQRLAKAGANGVTLFSRFYQPDIDLESLEVEPSLRLSDSHCNRLPLHWIALLYKRIDVSFAATSGVRTCEDVLELVMTGADVAMISSALLKFGPKHLTQIREELAAWVEENGYGSIERMKASLSGAGMGDTEAYERVNYLRTLEAYRLVG